MKHDSLIEYAGPERRHALPLSEDQIEAIAEKAADRAVEKMKAAAYQGLGQAVVTKVAWLFGAGVTVLYFLGAI